MSADSDLEDIVRICRFYCEPGWPFHVDLENLHVTMGDYGVDPVRENGRLVGYLVEDPTGFTRVVEDLDYYFQEVFEWGYRC